jgi:hypothetical protein
MNMHRFLTGTRGMLSIIPILGILLLGNTSALAQVGVTSSVVIPLTGTVGGGAGQENVNFANTNVQIESTLSRDPDFNAPPVVILNIKFVKNVGTGATTNVNYTGDTWITKIRTLKGTDTIQVTFPFSQGNAVSAANARSGLATLTLTFDTNGVITGGSGTIGTNTF